MRQKGACSASAEPIAIESVAEINAGVQGVPPFLAHHTIDTHEQNDFTEGQLSTPRHGIT